MPGWSEDPQEFENLLAGISPKEPMFCDEHQVKQQPDERGYHAAVLVDLMVLLQVFTLYAVCR